MNPFRRKKQDEPVPAHVDWHYDGYLRQRALAETWRKLAGGQLVVIGILTASTVFFATHVERERIIVRVDNATGAVDLLPGNDPKGLSEIKKLAATQAWIFVNAHERYNFYTWRHDYDQAGSMASPEIRLAMYNMWESKEPGVSPLYTYRQNGEITVDRISTQFDPRYENVVWVTFMKTTKAGSEVKKERLKATLVYTFEGGTVPAELEQFNPVKFMVLKYDVVPDNGEGA